jgi:hypothetical protein
MLKDVKAWLRHNRELIHDMQAVNAIQAAFDSTSPAACVIIGYVISTGVVQWPII